MAKDDKKPRKILPKNKKVSKIPSGQNVKIIEISLSKFITPLIGLLVIASLFWTYRNLTGENIVINEKIGLNQIISAYNSGAYEEIVIE